MSYDFHIELIICVANLFEQQAKVECHLGYFSALSVTLNKIKDYWASNNGKIKLRRRPSESHHDVPIHAFEYT